MQHHMASLAYELAGRGNCSHRAGQIILGDFFFFFKGKKDREEAAYGDHW